MIDRVYLAAMRNGPVVLFALAIINTVVTFLALGTRAGFMGMIGGLNSGLIPFIAALVIYRFDRWQAVAE